MRRHWRTSLCVRPGRRGGGGDARRGLLLLWGLWRSGAYGTHLGRLQQTRAEGACVRQRLGALRARSVASWLILFLGALDRGHLGHGGRRGSGPPRSRCAYARGHLARGGARVSAWWLMQVSAPLVRGHLDRWQARFAATSTTACLRTGPPRPWRHARADAWGSFLGFFVACLWIPVAQANRPDSIVSPTDQFDAVRITCLERERLRS